jgi:hypothetical protein
VNGGTAGVRRNKAPPLSALLLQFSGGRVMMARPPLPFALPVLASATGHNGVALLATKVRR